MMDTNHDGVQDETETGVNGITVTLYYVNGVAGPSVQTVNGPDERPGFYLFDDLLAGTYSIGFGDLPAGHVFTAKDSPSASVATDSNASRTTGRTATFVLDETLPAVNTIADGSGLKAGNVLRDIDAGIYREYSLGNRVWNDTNGNSVLDTAGPSPEQGIDGVTVNLYAAGSDGSATGAVIATAVTDNGGYYLFTHLLSGDFVVVIPASQFAAGGRLVAFHSSGTVGTTEQAPAAADGGIDSDDNGSKATTGIFSGAVVSFRVVLGPVADEPVEEPATKGFPYRG